MDYECEDKVALCRGTLELAKADAAQAGATVARTFGGDVPLRELLSSGIPWARGGWTFEAGDPHGAGDGRVGAIVEVGGVERSVFPVFVEGEVFGPHDLNCPHADGMDCHCAELVAEANEPSVCLAGNPTVGDLPCGDPDCVCR